MAIGSAPSTLTTRPTVREGIRLHLVGALLLMLAVGWTYMSAAVAGGDPSGPAALMLGSATAFVGAVIIAAREPVLIPAMVSLVIAALGVAFRAELSAPGPLRGPLGYTNATAALYLQGAIAGLMVATAARGIWRIVGLTFALGLAVATVLTGSQAANLLALLPLTALLVRPGRASRALIVGFLGMFLLALASSTTLGVVWPVGGVVGRGVDATISDRRPALWHDAILLTARNPVVGVGPGRFRYESPVARSDRDAVWAHNGYLQQGAEGGLPALVLTVSLFVWGFVRLAVVRRPDVIAALGAASLASLGIQSSIDYVLHFAWIPIVGASLVGAAVGARPPRQAS